jgi:hypothetical protein
MRAKIMEHVTPALQCNRLRLDDYNFPLRKDQIISRYAVIDRFRSGIPSLPIIVTLFQWEQTWVAPANLEIMVRLKNSIIIL